MLAQTADQIHYGRRAFGPGRKRSPQEKARHIAESILLHEAEGDAVTPEQYGMDATSPQWQQVRTALHSLRLQQEGRSHMKTLSCPHCQGPLRPYPLLPLFPKDCYWCATCKKPVLLPKEV